MLATMVNPFFELCVLTRSLPTTRCYCSIRRGGRYHTRPGLPFSRRHALFHAATCEVVHRLQPLGPDPWSSTGIRQGPPAPSRPPPAATAPPSPSRPPATLSERLARVSTGTCCEYTFKSHLSDNSVQHKRSTLTMVHAKLPPDNSVLGGTIRCGQWRRPSDDEKVLTQDQDRVRAQDLI
jgi:hypothetical protein